jgi:hypothetical protein
MCQDTRGRGRPHNSRPGGQRYISGIIISSGRSTSRKNNNAARVGHPKFPQGLKPLVFIDLFGTIEVVP